MMKPIGSGASCSTRNGSTSMDGAMNFGAHSSRVLNSVALMPTLLSSSVPFEANTCIPFSLTILAPVAWSPWQCVMMQDSHSESLVP